MLKARLYLLLLLLGFSLFFSVANADVLILKNGDRLTGEVLNKSNDVLLFKTAYAGTLSIKWLEVSEINSDKPMTLLLENNRIFKGSEIKKLADSLRVKNVVGNKITELEESTVLQINPESWLLGAGYKFSGMINVGLKYDRGNNNNDEIDLDGKLEYRLLYHRLSIYGQYDENRAEGVTTKLKWLASASYDFFPRKDWHFILDAQDWYVGLGLNLKKDAFARLNLRSQIGPHVGYQFFESKPLNFFVQGGLEAVKEEFSDEDNNAYWAATWRFKYDKYLYKEKLQFYILSDGLYGFASPDKTLLENWLGFRIPLKAGFLASVEAEADYDSQPAENTDKFSTSYRVKLGYEF